MRVTSTLLLLFCVAQLLNAQATLVRSYPNDTFDLASLPPLRLVDMALVKGLQSTPINLAKPVVRNLLHWRYHDEVSQENVITESEPVWTKGTQLVEDMPATELISLHLNLSTKDTVGQDLRVYLVMGGVTRQSLAAVPTETRFDADIDTPMRFSAFVEILLRDGSREIYDCIEGSCWLNSLDTQKRTLSGTFEFTGNRIGMNQRGYFVNGVFSRGEER